ncbi:DUF2075 domain-containing protein [Candidatus Nomurabacteria bacterium]|nr:DUF2075 domain-containing protein [Candidatus Nomurabacteria bacterium]
MTQIITFPFKQEGFEKIKNYHFGKNWPVVYIIEDIKGCKEMYIGETINAYYRSKQHFEKPERRKLKNIHIISDQEYNKSATLDTESWLIQYISAEESITLQNGNGGLKNHNYFDREKYKTKFEEIIWQKLRNHKLVTNDLQELKNSDLFKYSPYKTLSDDQLLLVKEIYKKLKDGQDITYLINGKPGTGKTVLAIYLLKYLKEKEATENLEIGLVVPMTSLRKTIKKVFSKVKGLKSSMILGPNDVTKKKYDLLIVDESHRLQQRLNLANFKSYDDTNKKLKLPKESTQLDWILNSSKNHIFLYDQNQTIRPADINREIFSNLKATKRELTSQMRVEGGEEYISFIEGIFENVNLNPVTFKDYDFQIYDDIGKMITDIKTHNKIHGLSRVVAGYAWPWHTKKKKEKFDIKINGLELVWNSKTEGWVESENSINEIGCIHTIQGYDLNYTGVIIGPEISYDFENTKFIIDKNKYMDFNGKRSASPEELEQYIINIYKTLLTRGIKGTYVYICDENLRKYFMNVFMKGKKYQKVRV